MRLRLAGTLSLLSLLFLYCRYSLLRQKKYLLQLTVIN